jgi:hypothetical protein
VIVSVCTVRPERPVAGFERFGFRRSALGFVGDDHARGYVYGYVYGYGYGYVYVDGFEGCFEASDGGAR